MVELKDIVRKQKEFQQMVGYPVDSILETERNEVSEKYLFKLIEEVVELRKEFPSAANPWSKSQKVADFKRVKEELADVLLFLINFVNVWKFTPEEILETLEKVQTNNFMKIKEKKMNILNSEILKVPGYVTGTGSGCMMPRYIFVGQNPGKSIEHGYKFWSNENDGSSKVLLPILDKLGIRDECYLTNVVKCTTDENEEPSDTLTNFWWEFLEKELDILMYGNDKVKIITMGNNAEEVFFYKGRMYGTTKIPHPATVLYGSLTPEQYEEKIKQAIG